MGRPRVWFHGQGIVPVHERGAGSEHVHGDDHGDDHGYGDGGVPS